MDKIVIIGGKTLNGKIKISGSKNSALPILASSLFTKDKISISNIPNLSDVTSMFDLLKSLNVNIKKKLIQLILHPLLQNLFLLLMKL